MRVLGFDEDDLRHIRRTVIGPTGVAFGGL